MSTIGTRVAPGLVFIITIASLASWSRPQRATETDQSATVSTPPPNQVGNEPLKLRIEAQINQLRNESLEQSLTNLIDVNLFFWPGGRDPDRNGRYISGPLIPLAAYAGELDLSSVMSNRRFIKIYQQLSLLEKSQAAAVVNKELQSTLPVYRALFSESLNEQRPKFLKEKMGDAQSYLGPTFIIENSPDGKPVVIGAKLKILSLVWLAGALELEQAAPQVNAVIAEAVEQRRQRYADSETIPLFNEQMLTKASLYNRQILATAALGVSQRAGAANDIAKNLGIEWDTKTLAHYDAERTSFDLPLGSNTNFKNGSIALRHIRAIDDGVFDQLLNQMRLP